MPQPTGVLLDVDGTLVNSNDAHAWAWVRALAENGITVPFEKVRPLIGMGGDKLLPEVARKTGGKPVSVHIYSCPVHKDEPTPIFLRA